jgi:hypothetical protein
MAANGGKGPLRHAGLGAACLPVGSITCNGTCKLVWPAPSACLVCVASGLCGTWPAEPWWQSLLGLYIFVI